MYIACHNIGYNGRLLRIGDNIPEDMPDDMTERLLGAGAIRLAPDAITDTSDAIQAELPADSEETTEDALEIDVMDGIVEVPKKRSAKRTGRRKAE